MVHFYIDRHWKNKTYRLLCTKKHFEPKDHESRPRTIAILVTCPDCLKILIERNENLLAALKENFRKAAPAESAAQPMGYPISATNSLADQA